MLAKTLARSIDCTVRRIQFTPDLLPSDVTGVNMFNQDMRAFEFRPGAIFANVVVGDEINRASPKTQSALLECMEEGQVTVDGRTYTLPHRSSSWRPRTPSRWRAHRARAQRDRFMARVSSATRHRAARWTCSNPTAATSDAARDRHRDGERTDQAVRTVHTSDAIRQYIVDLAAATHDNTSVRLAPPRARHCTCCGDPRARRWRTRLRAARRQDLVAGLGAPPHPHRRGDPRPPQPADVLRGLTERVRVPAPGF